MLWAVTSIVTLLVGLAARSVAGVKVPVLLLVAVAATSPFLLDKSFEKDLLSWHVGALGEEQVGRALARLAPDGFRALHDVEAAGIGNIDHVVFGPSGAFAIETKAWTGTVYPGKGGRLMCNGQDRQGATRQAAREAMEVAKRLRGEGLTVWVQPVIVLTRARVNHDLVFNRVPIVTLNQLPGFLRSARGKPLSAAEIDRCVSAVVRLGPS